MRTALVFIFACLFAAPLASQAPTAASASTAPAVAATTPEAVTDSGPVGIIPLVKGPNLSLVTTSQHDSSNGWSSLLSPDFAWRFSKHYSADVSIPLYDYINVLVTGGTTAKPTYTYEIKHHALGDTALNGRFEVHPKLLSYIATLTLGLPSGNTTYGLGSGQVTYNINHHFEKDFDFFTPDIELGIGDNSSLIGSRIRKSYVTVGELAYFQAGGSISLPWDINFESDAYEELPLNAQTHYSTTGKGKKKVTTATGKTEAEDNGFINSIDIPLGGHVTLSGFYNRSLINKIDTAGFSLTFLLRAPPREKPGLVSH